MQGMDFIDAFLQKLVENIFGPVVLLLGVLAFLYFVFGVVMFIRSAEDEEARRTGKAHMLWAIIGLAIIFGANAIINLINDTANSVLP